MVVGIMISELSILYVALYLLPLPQVLPLLLLLALLSLLLLKLAQRPFLPSSL